MSFINKTCTTVSKAICFSTPSRHCPRKGVIHFHLKKKKTRLFFNRIKMQDLLSASLSCIYITPSLVQKMHTNKIKMLKKSDLCLIYCESNTWKKQTNMLYVWWLTRLQKCSLTVADDTLMQVQLSETHDSHKVFICTATFILRLSLLLYPLLQFSQVSLCICSPLSLLVWVWMKRWWDQWY